MSIKYINEDGTVTTIATLGGGSSETQKEVLPVDTEGTYNIVAVAEDTTTNVSIPVTYNKTSTEDSTTVTTSSFEVKSGEKSLLKVTPNKMSVSSESFDVPTPNSGILSDNNKYQALNRDYLHQNVKLSREGAGNSEDWNKVGVILDGVLANNKNQRVFRTGTTTTYSNLSVLTQGVNSSSAGAELTQVYKSSNSIFSTKDYNYAVYLDDPSVSSESAFLLCTDKNGLCLNITVSGIQGSSVYYNCIGSFHPKLREQRPEYANYLYVYNNQTGNIALYNGKIFLGYVNDGAVFQFTGDIPTSVDNTQMVGPKNYPIVYLGNNDSTIGWVLGVNELGEYDPLFAKRTDIPKTRSHQFMVASGNENIWIPQATSNQISCIRPNGSVSTFSVYDEAGQVIDTASYVGLGNFAFLELDNGDVVYVTATSLTSTSKQGFTYIDDTLANVGKEAVFHEFTEKYTYITGSNHYVAGSYFPMFETDDFVFFFQTCFQESGTGALRNVTPKTTYQVLNKVSKEVTSRVTPWTAGYDTIGPRGRIKTQGGYWWIFPSTYSSTATNNSPLVIVIGPDGTSRTVDLGTDTSTRWLFSKINRYNGTASFLPGGENIGVTKNGIGCVVSCNGEKVLLFRGDGEFVVYDYTDKKTTTGPFKLYSDSVGVIEDGNPGIIPCGNGFFIHNENTSGNIYTSYVTYIKLQPNNTLAEPDYYSKVGTNRLSLNNAFNLKYFPYYQAEDYEKRSKVRHDDWLKAHPAWLIEGLPLGAFFTLESLADGSDDIIYLKDGDYVIDSTYPEEQSGVNYSYDGKGNAKVTGDER